MIVAREYLTETEEFKIGDRITIGKYTATCQKVNADTAVFCLDQYLDKAHSRTGAEEWLNSEEVLGFFETRIQGGLLSFPDGSKLRLPYFGEIFGPDDEAADLFTEDHYKQWPLMKNRKNRVAFRNNEAEFGWLQNRSVGSASPFALVHIYGYANRTGASYAFGIRPVFIISNHKS